MRHLYLRIYAPARPRSLPASRPPAPRRPRRRRRRPRRAAAARSAARHNFRRDEIPPRHQRCPPQPARRHQRTKQKGARVAPQRGGRRQRPVRTTARRRRRHHARPTRREAAAAHRRRDRRIRRPGGRFRAIGTRARIGLAEHTRRDRYKMVRHNAREGGRSRGNDRSAVATTHVAKDSASSRALPSAASTSASMWTTCRDDMACKDRVS